MLALILVALWLVAYRASSDFTIAGSFLSIFHIPAGVTLAVYLAAPRWQKLTPVIAHLLLAFPQTQQLLDLPLVSAANMLTHAARFHLIYGGAALVLLRFVRIALPFSTLVDMQRYLGVALSAVTVSALWGAAPSFLDGYSILDFQRTAAWWLGDAMGVLAIPPILAPLLLQVTGRKRHWQWPRPGEWALQLGVIGIAAGVGAMGPPLGLNLWFTTMPPAIVFALYGGIGRAATATLLTCLLPPLMFLLVHDGGDYFSFVPLLPTTAVAALLIGAAMHDRTRVAEELEAQVAARTLELEEAYEMQRHLVRSLGHDLRQPVEAINLTLDGLAAQPQAAGMTPALNRARAIGASASDLLTRILTYARMDVGDLSPQIEVITLDQVLPRLRALYEPVAERAGVHLVIADDRHELRSDAALLYQALSNLLDNALRLSPRGATVSVVTEKNETGLALLVIDAIAGPVPRRGGGKGLGLRIVRQIAQLLGAAMIDQPNRKGVLIPHSR